MKSNASNALKSLEVGAAKTKLGLRKKGLVPETDWGLNY